MASSSLQVHETSLEDVFVVHESIPEFVSEFPYTLDTFYERTEGKAMLCLLGCMDDKPVGYIVAYDRDNDGSFYCWMAGVDPAFRRNGVLSTLMSYLEQWTVQHGYNPLRIKTRNNRREMLSFLIRNDFLCTGVEPNEDVQENRITFEKPL